MGVFAPTSPDSNIPISERITPRSPNPLDTKPRSKVYSEQKLNNDYEMFLEGSPEYNKSNPLPEKQKELFHLYEKGEVKDPIQAWEWFLGRKWDEFDAEERKLVSDNLNDQEKGKFGHLLR